MSDRPGMFFIVLGSHAWSVCWEMHSGRLPDLNPAKVDDASTRLLYCGVAETHLEFEELVDVYTWNLCLGPYCVCSLNFCGMGLESVDAGLAEKGKVL